MFTILLNNGAVTTVGTEVEVLNWFHENLTCSLYHAARYMGYTIQHSSGIVFYAE